MSKYLYTDDATMYECCPECGEEVEIPLGQLTDCPECGHKRLLPCSRCRDLNACDWRDDGKGGTCRVRRNAYDVKGLLVRP